MTRVPALVIAGPWMIAFFVDYMRRLFEAIRIRGAK